MCGIVGYVDAAVSRADGDAILARMREAIRHRGPDDEGQLVGNGTGLGVQRLSVVDIGGGHQPMTSGDGHVWLAFNGEIYNHDELRRHHEAIGRSFRTRSDTEVVLAHYERYGLAGIHDFNGMFGFAIWDVRSGELHLVRDRLGVKPLYYYTDGRRLYFASEIKALVASGQIPTEPNEHAVWDYLTFRYVPAPQTIWTDIKKLPPAHTLTLRVDRPVAAPKRYWDMPYVERRETFPAADDEEFRALLRDACHLRMLADVPVGIFLSGGLDSSMIAALVDRQMFPQLQTYSITLEDAGADDERAFASQVARHLGTDHREIVISDSQFVDMLPDVPRQMDEPMADPTCIPVYVLAKAARERLKVVLSGEGADEILAGYTFDYIQKTWDEIANGNGVGQPVRYPESLDQRRAAVPLHITNYLSSDEKRRLFVGGRSYTDSNDVLHAALARVKDDHPLHQSLYLYCQNWLVEDLLMKADKMTMAASVELRTPFLDYRLVEWAARAPASAKVRRMPGGRYETKAVLRDYARELLPAAIVDRPKQGFPVPIYRWLSDRLRPFAFDLLGDPQALSHRWLDPQEMRLILDNGTAVSAPTMERHRLWNLIVLELWARAWLRP